jgi:hypothetical protein
MRQTGSAVRGRCRYKRSESRAAPLSILPRMRGRIERVRLKKPAGEKVACLTYLGLRAAAPTLGEGGDGCAGRPKAAGEEANKR